MLKAKITNGYVQYVREVAILGRDAHVYKTVGNTETEQLPGIPSGIQVESHFVTHLYPWQPPARNQGMSLLSCTSVTQGLPVLPKMQCIRIGTDADNDSGASPVPCVFRTTSGHHFFFVWRNIL